MITDNVKPLIPVSYPVSPPSAYEQKQPTGMKPSSPVTPPCSTPVSPLHHASPTAAPTPKPDRTYPHLPSSQPLSDGTYSMDHRY